ncbi:MULTISPECIES: sulfotransferase domain-containing protein [Sphingopyxis]|uniref:Sulfotransferase n=1 Tax=Sphingopyxis granuli TaxID=267128 RepID=A0AA86GNH7_9SPHN|nr:MULTISPECIES: sulfotransferase domain-containing protein [Sphingopyxis]AMG76213.1 Sulfotransferase [Sphingopyxis granuli]
MPASIERGERRDREEAPGTAAAPSGILWIASYPKSGNTWTRAFLNNLLKIMQDDDAGAPQSINRMTEYTLWDIAAKPYERHLGKPVTEADRAEIARIRPAVQAEIAERTEGLAMVKTHHALVSDRGVPAINFAVTSGAIYIVRNPLDVAISYAHHLGSDIDYAIGEMALRNKETGVSDKSVYEIYGSWSQHVESWTRAPHRAIHVMRYEDMLADPAAAFGALARHLLLSPSPEQLATAMERSSFAALKQQEDEAGFSEKPDSAERFFREGRADQWRDRLTPRQVRAVVTAHHQQMRRFGYLTDELLPLLE